jgi:hypothetical protein
MNLILKNIIIRAINTPDNFETVYNALDIIFDKLIIIPIQKAWRKNKDIIIERNKIKEKTCYYCEIKKSLVGTVKCQNF